MYFESANIAKPGKSFSEDLTGYQGDCIWCLDGATPPQQGTDTGDTLTFVQTADTQIRRQLMADGGAPLPELIARVVEILSSHSVLQKEYHPCATLALIRYRENILDYFVLGDAVASIRTSSQTITVTDDRLDKIAVEERQKVRLLAQEGFERGDFAYDTARNALIETESRSRNRPGGFWVLSNQPEAAHQALTGSVTLQKNEFFSALCLSDGLFRLTTHMPAPVAPDELIDYLRQHGFKKAIETLRENEETYARPKALSASIHDDASGILMSPLPV